jgi:hypothetical protein
VLIQQRFQAGNCMARDIRGRLSRLRAAAIGRRRHMCLAYQWTIGILEQRDIGDRQRAYGLAMVTPAKANKLALLRLTTITPKMKAHLQGNFDRRCTVGRVKAVPQQVAGNISQALVKLNDRVVSEAGQHRMLEQAKLVCKRRIDAGVRVTKQIHPPGTDAVQIASAFMVVKPHALPATDWHQGQGFMMLHLSARMPDTAQTTRDPVGFRIDY